MLNRAFIVIGVLAILALAAAFAVPRLMPWNDYRGRIETAASDAVGAPVKIDGDIHFALLPNPRIELGEVKIGPPDAPTVRIADVTADLSLPDFLRNRYTVTRLELSSPEVSFKIDADGRLASGIGPIAGMAAANVSVADARIDNGTVTFADARSGKRVTARAIDGTLSLSALAGPLSFSGAGEIGGTRYSARIATSALDKDGTSQVTVSASPVAGGASLDLSGVVLTGAAPRLVGDLAYRRSPGPEAVAAGVGDLVLTGKLDASPAKLMLSDLTLEPDENQAGTRLSGSATVTLGRTAVFSAGLAARVVAQPPRDATRNDGPQPYEWMRQLAELPMPPIPPIAGTLKLDVAQLDLRALPLRNVHADLETDGVGWTINNATASIGKATTVTLTGTLNGGSAGPRFAGEAQVATRSLDELAGLWRKPEPGNPLFHVPATLSARVSLADNDLALTDGRFELDHQAQHFSAVIGLVGTRSLDLTTDFGKLTPADSSIIAALLPPLGGNSTLAVSFPQGTLTANADEATLFGLDGTGLMAKAEWGDTGLHVMKLAANSFGGAKLDGTLSLAGDLAAPRVSGQMTVGLTDPSAPALARLIALVEPPAPIAAAMARALPANLHLRLNDPSPDGVQTANINGTAGAADLNLTAVMDAGLAKALSGPLKIEVEADSNDPTALTAQLGLGDTSLMPQGIPVHISARLDGTVAAGFRSMLTVKGGSDRLSYDGTLKLADPAEPAGAGTLQFDLSDPTAMARLLVGDGIYLPPIEAKARLAFAGTKSIRLEDIEGRSAGTNVSGRIALAPQGDLASVTGDLALGGLDLPALTAVVAGPTALINASDRLWPVGPFAIGESSRQSIGDVHVTAADVATGGPARISNFGFDFVWDQKGQRLSHLSGAIGGGTLSGEIGLCCAGTNATKTLTARASLENVDFAAILPEDLARKLSGRASGTISLQGSGGTLAEAVSALGGSGTLTATGLKIADFDPRVFSAVAAVDDLVDAKPAELTSMVTEALDKGNFTAPKLTAGFAVADGVLRLSNLAADAPQGHLFGSLEVSLADLGLTGSFALSPAGVTDPKGLLAADTAKVTAVLSGTLLAPTRKLDLAALVDAIKMRAYELEVARLEKLKAQADARRKAADEDAARQRAAEQKDDSAAKPKAADAAAAPPPAPLAAPPRPEPPPLSPVAGPPSGAFNPPASAPDFTTIPQPAPLQQPLDLGIPQTGY